jgi:hypothetical protein
MWINPPSMDFHSSQASEVSNLDCKQQWALAMSLNVTWRGKLRQSRFYLKGCEKDAYIKVLYGQTYAPLNVVHGKDISTSSQPASHVSPGPLQVNVKDTMTNDTCGSPQDASLTNCAHDMCLSRTCREWSMWDLNRFGETFTEWVTRWKRESLVRQRSAQDIYGKDYSYLPTPNACLSDGNSRPEEKAQGKRRYTLMGMARTGMLGTPGRLNPQFVEWLMGFPIGWTACEPLVTL